MNIPTDQMLAVYVAGVAAALTVIAIVVAFKWRSSERARASLVRLLADFEEKYRPIVDVDKAIAESKRQLSEAESAFRTQESALDKSIADL
jgi:hypothetical protein